MNVFSTKLADELVLSDSKYIEPGIHENVIISSVESFTSPNGSKAIIFNFEKDGKTGNHTEWEPKKWSSSETDEQLQEKTSKLVRRVKSFLLAYYKPEEVEFEGSSFQQFIDWVVMKSQAMRTEKYRVKFVYNNKGYISLPNYIIPPFIQKMSDTTITVVPDKKDQMTKPVVADAEPKKDDKDDLPF